MVKVLYVHDGPTERFEGRTFGGSFTNKYVKRYLRLGDCVTKLTRVKNIENEEDIAHYSEVTDNAFNFVPIPEFKTLRTVKNILKVKHVIKNEVERHDVIVVKFPSYSASHAWKIAKRLGKPVLVELGGCPFDSLRFYDWRGRILAPFMFLKYKVILKKASHVVYVTNKFLQQRYPTRGKSIGCSNVELPPIDEINLRNRITKIHNQREDNELTLMTVASLTSYKGHVDVIKGLFILKTEGYKFNYTIIGNGNADLLKGLVSHYDLDSQVKILGGLPHDLIYEYLKTCDLYIQPSRTEGLPRAVIEALSMACPVLGSDAGGIPELIHGECVFKRGNTNDLVDKLKQVDKKFLLKHAKLNFDNAKNYQQEVLSERRGKFYTDFLKDYKSKW